MIFENTLAFAQQLDKEDNLNHFRNKFHFPKINGKETIYFTGNSLGLQPKSAKEYIDQELEDWANLGVEGHFEAKTPWFSYHEMFPKLLSKLVGAKENELVVMNALTVNLHLLMVSFYQPTKQRYKILCEAKAFPSDQYAIESQVKFHGFEYEDAVIEVSPRQGEHTIREEDIFEAIKDNRNEIALVLIGGVNYYTGQRFDMKSIAQKAHEIGAKVGFDLAHATGNVELNLHDWEVDFAVWCSYKYLNSGAGAVSGVFIHEKHCKNTNLKRFAGWWGHDKASRFKMNRGFVPMQTAEAWQMSNAPVFNMVIHKASLDIFEEAGIDNLFAKRDKLTAYMEFVINDVSSNSHSTKFEIITPKEKYKRGSQLSILSHGKGKELFDFLTQNNVIADWREPNVIRIAPVPMYNSFEDCYRFGEILKRAL